MSRALSAYSDSERAEHEFIRLHGQCGVETILDTWLDAAPRFKPVVSTALRDKLKEALAMLSDVEVAEWASILCEGPGFEEWMGDQE